MTLMKIALIFALVSIVWVSAINMVREDLEFLIDWIFPINEEWQDGKK